MARSRKAREALETIPSLLEYYRQGTLAAAFRGDLTGDWRTIGEQKWSVERAADVCAKVQSGGTPKDGFKNEPGVPFLKVYNIVNQQVRFEERPQYVDIAAHAGPLAKSVTLPGDVLMNIVGPPLGKVAVVPDQFPEWNINQAITLFRPSSRISTGWLYWILCGGQNISEIIHETKGSAGQVNISLSQCRDFVFPVPPMEEQLEIVRRLEGLFDHTDAVEARLRELVGQLDALNQSILAKAFRGELVPQDSADEPAEILLARIRGVRDEEKDMPKTRKNKSLRLPPKKSQVEVPMLNHQNLSQTHLASILRERGPLTAEVLWSLSKLDIDEFYDALKNEEARGSLREVIDDSGMRRLEAFG